MFLGEKTLSQLGQLNFENEVESIFERVRTHNTSVVGQKNHTTAQSPIRVVQEFVFKNGKLARVLSFGFGHHNFGELSFALFDHSLDKFYFFLAHFQLNLFLQQLDHALHNQVFERGNVHFVFGAIIVLKAIFCGSLQIFETFIAFAHLFETRGVGLLSHLNAVLNVQIFQLLGVLSLQNLLVLLNKRVALFFKVPLTEHLNLESSLVSILPHGAFKLKSVSV